MKPSIKVLNIGEQTYIFNRRIFQAGFILMIVLFVALFLSYGFGVHFSYSCPDDAVGGRCQNMFWSNCSKNAFYTCADIKDVPEKYSYLTEREFLFAGDSYGEKPGFLFNYFGAIFGLVFFFAFFINHRLYNRGFDFKKLVRGVE